MVKIAVSILNSKQMKQDISSLNNTNVDYIHLDIMDGKFVPNKTLSMSEIRNVLKDNKKTLDVHLMVDNPTKYIEEYALFQTEYITIHKEIKNVAKYIEMIKGYGLKCGLSIKPNTKVEDIFPLLEHIDLVLVMSVEPGAGGQVFQIEALEKIRRIKEEIIKRNLNVVIEVDGGINDTNNKECIESGADILVSGTYIIGNNNFQEQINKLRA